MTVSRMPGAVDQAEEEEEEATTGSEEVHSAECCTEDLAAEGEVGRSPARSGLLD